MNALEQINLANESPVEVDDKDIFANDKLNFESVVKNIAILLSRVQKPYTVGIFGDWGAGKTSFMKMLQQLLEQDDKKFATCWFDAWKYETEDNLILPLLHQVSYTFRDMGQEIKDSLIKSASVVGMSFLDMFLKTSTVGLFNKNDVVKNFKLFEENSARFYQHFSDSVMQLEDAFKQCVTEALNSAEKETLVIFIDDLDRCLPEHVINLLERIKNYLIVDGVNVIFIIGVDKKILEKSVIAKYGTDLIDGNKYLEKIINLPFPLPDIDINRVDYVNSLFHKHIPGQEDKHKDVEVKLKDIASNLELKNPRRLRKVIMRLSFYLIFKKEESSKHVFAGLLPEIIIFMILFKEFYPEAYSLAKANNQIFYKPREHEVKTGQVLSFSEISDNYCKEWAEIIYHEHKIKLIKIDWFKNGIFASRPQPQIDTTMRTQHLYFDAIDFLYTLSQ